MNPYNHLPRTGDPGYRRRLFRATVRNNGVVPPQLRNERAYRQRNERLFNEWEARYDRNRREVDEWAAALEEERLGIARRAGAAGRRNAGLARARQNNTMGFRRGGLRGPPTRYGRLPPPPISQDRFDRDVERMILAEERRYYERLLRELNEFN